MILIPFLNYVVSAPYVPFIITVGSLFSSVGRIFVFFKHIRWKIFRWFVPFSIPSVIAGAYLIKFINPLYLQLLVSVFLIINLPELFKSKKEIEQEKVQYPIYVVGLIGMLAGFVSGIAGAIGLIFNRFYLRYGLTKEEIIATRAANEIFLHLIKLSVYSFLHLYSGQSVFLGIVIATGALVSSYLMKYILLLLSESFYRKLGYLSMVLSGFYLLFHTSANIIYNDKIYFKSNQYGESVFHWRNYEFVLEFSINEGLEIETFIDYRDLPRLLKQKYDELETQYEKIFAEKIYTLHDEPKYEFHCIKNGNVTTFEFEINNDDI